MEKILVTGSSGFIGFHLCKKLLNEGYKVFGIDNMNNYYNVNLKKNRLAILRDQNNFTFNNLDISDLSGLSLLFKKIKPDKVVNLAAQAGVRYSLENPHAYIKTNVSGFMNVLECSRAYNIKGLIYASSSSVYGGNKKTPFSVRDRVDSPISIYAASKKANELMAHTYSHLYGLNTTGLRFFTVYGPWGRPDMAMYIFTRKILNGSPLPVFNNGNMLRDFTYIDDIVEGVLLALNKNYRLELFNLGNNKFIELMKVIKILEKKLGKKANINFLGMQKGDVQKTYADIDHSISRLNFKPKTSIEEGISNFIKWYKKYTSTSL